MRYFVDVEFNGFGGGLVSIAAVPEHEIASPFYEAALCNVPTLWVAKNVLPVLQTRPIDLGEVKRQFSNYIHSDREAVIIADWPEDIAHAANLLTDGNGKRLAPGTVMFELLSASDFSSETHSKVPHNAYYDALALRDWVMGSER